VTESINGNQPVIETLEAELSAEHPVTSCFCTSIRCPCGFEASGYNSEAINNMYAIHVCNVNKRPDWDMVAAIIAGVVVICFLIYAALNHN